MRCRTATQARTALIAGISFFVAAQLLFDVIADGRHPGLFDAEFGFRFALLRSRLAETPDRPLLLLMGSSRTVMSFRPEILPELRTATGAQVLPFNYSHLAAGPVLTLMEYTRLRRAGVRPNWIVLEVMPPCLSNRIDNSTTGSMTALELPLLHKYVEWPKLYGRFFLTRLIPWYRHRNEIVHRVAPAWITPGNPLETELIRLGPLGGDDGWALSREETPELIQRATASAKEGYYPPMQEFRIKETATQAYREFLALCRKDGVQVVLLLTPESTEFRRWYAADGPRQIDDWCAKMRRQEGVAIVDARNWLDDGDFLDGHHVLKRGADAFTKRLGEELLVPLVKGESRFTDAR